MGPNSNSTQPTPTPSPVAPSMAPGFSPTPAPQSPAPAPMTPRAAAPSGVPAKEGGVGALIGSIIIVIIIVAGGLYFWGKALEKKNVQPAAPSTNETSSLDATQANAQAAASANIIASLPPAATIPVDQEIDTIEQALNGLQGANSDADLASF